MHCVSPHFDAAAAIRGAQTEHDATVHSSWGEECSSLALTSWSPTGILTENLAGLEPLASSATAADALAATCLYAGALLRTPARARDACEGGVERRRWCCCCGAAGSGFTEVLPSIYFVCILSEPSIGDGRPKTGLGPSV
jgi:hypothetical protein